MHSALERIDANRLRVRARDNLDITLYANEQVYLDAASVDEIRSFAAIADTLATLNSTATSATVQPGSTVSF